MPTLADLLVEPPVRHVQVSVTYHLKGDFRLVVANDRDPAYGDPRCWTASLIDYDDNTGAIGIFATEDEARDRLDDFLALAMPAYREKLAKHTGSPVITVGEDGHLVMKVIPYGQEALGEDRGLQFTR